jgi:hypothetical protein
MSEINSEISRVRSILNDLVSKDNVRLTDKEVVKLSMKLDKLINCYLNGSKDIKYRN